MNVCEFMWFHERGKAKLRAVISSVIEATKTTHTLLN